MRNAECGMKIAPNSEFRTPHCAVFAWLVACCLSLVATVGCGKPVSQKPSAPAETTAAAPEDPNADQQLSAFTLTSHGADGAKRWELSGQGASMSRSEERR